MATQPANSGDDGHGGHGGDDGDGGHGGHGGDDGDGGHGGDGGDGADGGAGGGGAGVLGARPSDGISFAGQDPQTAAVEASADSRTRCATRTRMYRHDRLAAEGFPVDDIGACLQHEDGAVWLDLHSPGPYDLEVLTEQFGLHPLALEDALHQNQRPKIDRYPTHLFLSTYAVGRQHDTHAITVSELAVFVTGQALITVRKDDGFDIETLLARWDAESQMPGGGVARLLHGLLDVLADGHFTAVRHLDETIEGLEEELFTDETGSSGGQRGRDFDRRSFAVRKDLILTRRVVAPMRDVLDTLLRRELRLVPEAMMPYFLDVRDHALRNAEWTESLREVANSILDTRVTLQSNRLNEIMRKLAVWAAIVAVPTAVTGFFGQNVPYPSFEAASGVILSATLMVLITVLIIVLFRRNDWL